MSLDIINDDDSNNNNTNNNASILEWDHYQLQL